MTGRGLTGLAALIVSAVVAIVTVREISIGREEVAEAEAASARSDWRAAVAHARAAAEAFLPGSPWPSRGALRLQTIGRDAEIRGDDETALLAYGALRTAMLATRAPIATSATDRWRTTAEGGLARVAASWSRPASSDGAEMARGARVPSRLAVGAPLVATTSILDELRDMQPVGSSALAAIGAASLAVIFALVRLATLGEGARQGGARTVALLGLMAYAMILLFR
jgi:hypothetical protein